MRRNETHKELMDFRKRLRSMPDDVDAALAWLERPADYDESTT